MPSEDPAVLRILGALDRMNATLIPMYNRIHEQSEARRQALRRIETLLQTQPRNIDEARELLQAVLSEVEGTLGGPLAKDVV